MQLFETLFLLTTVLLLVANCFYGHARRLHAILFWTGLGLLALHFVFEVPRWQIAFAYLLFIMLALLLSKRTTSHLAFRIFGFALGLLCLGVSVFQGIGMPIMKLPAPSGPFLVGTMTYTVIDESRAETQTDDPNDKRELFLEVWYPAERQKGETIPGPKSLWGELYAGKMDRVSFFMNYLRGVKTHSFQEVPANSADGPYPVIIFNHGLQMFTSQNTLLVEHLASHGFIVVSVAHPYESLRVNLPMAGTVIPEFIRSLENFQEAMTWIKRTSGPVLEAREEMKKVSSREERAQIMLKAIENSEINQIVGVWEADNRFVLDHLMSTDAQTLLFHEIMDTSRIGVMGMSVGGAAATELCKSDNRVKAAINVDGLQYGVRNHEPLKVPFMMLYSEDGVGTNDFLLLNSQNDFHEYYFRNVRHADFTDLTLVWPILRTYGQLGDIPGKRMVQLSNEVIQSFWDHYLKDQPLKSFERDDYPELEATLKFAK